MNLPKLLPVSLLRSSRIGKAMAKAISLVPGDSADARTGTLTLEMWKLGVKQEKSCSSIPVAAAHELLLGAIEASITPAAAVEKKVTAVAAVVVKHPPVKGCPNTANRYHECSAYCRKRWDQQSAEPAAQAKVSGAAAEAGSDAG